MTFSKRASKDKLPSKAAKKPRKKDIAAELLAADPTGSWFENEEGLAADVEEAKPRGVRGIVAIVGRPNVGKSTLFNMMTKSMRSIVDDQPGVTRDRIYGKVYYDFKREELGGFSLIDTGGFETRDLNYQPFTDNLVWHQTELAIQEADLILLMFDVKSGLHPHDRELVEYLKAQKKRVMYVANKLDGHYGDEQLWEFYGLGIDYITGISAAHNRGVDNLVIEAQRYLDEIPDLDVNPLDKGRRVAIVGKPNAGKSSIMNRLLGEDRSLVSDVAGTTRDPIDSPFVYNSKDYILVDTAGMRRKSKIKEKIEGLSVMMSLRAIERAQVVLLVIDAVEGLTDQDTRMAVMAVDECKPLIIVVNKWDLVQNKGSNSGKEYTEEIHRRLSGMTFVPVLYVSCLENQRVHQIMATVEQVMEQSQRRVGTSQVNGVLERAVREHNPALVRKLSHRIKFYYGTQVRYDPPTFVIMCNVAEDIQESYKRFLTHRFRAELGFGDIPIRLVLRGKKDANERREAKSEKVIPKYMQKKAVPMPAQILTGDADVDLEEGDDLGAE